MMWLLRIILVIIFSAIGSTVLVLGGLYIGYIIIKLQLGGKKKYIKESEKNNFKECNFKEFCDNTSILEDISVIAWFSLFIILLFVQFDNIYVTVDCGQSTEIVESEERPLKSLSMADSYKGYIYIVAGYGSGNLNNEITYKYFQQNDDGSYELKQISASKVKIIETDEEIPKIKKVKSATSYRFKDEPTWFGKMLFAKEKERWENYKEVEDISIYVPIGSIDNMQ